MKNPDLDNYDWRILLGLSEKGGSSSFNKLCDSLNKNKEGFSISVPTVKHHLSKLEEAGYVTHEKKGSQMIIYNVNPEKINEVNPLKKFWDKLKNIADSLRPDMDEFFSKSEDEQLSIILNMLMIRELYEIKAQIDFRLDKNSFEKSLAVAFWNHPLIMIYKEGMIRRCVKNEEYRRNIFKEIDKWLTKLK